MDERHWWIAGKIQESFHIGGYDNPTLLEDFLCDQTTLDLINNFLGSGGVERIFVYCNSPENGAINTSHLQIAKSISSLKVETIDKIIILYFLRHHQSLAVDASHIQRFLYCGELKGQCLDNMNAVISEIYLPLFRAQKDWGSSSVDSQAQFVHGVEKLLALLQESSSGTQGPKQWLLKTPENIISTDFRQNRLAVTDQTVIAEYEELVTEWIFSIEAIVTETIDDRSLDPNAGPLYELDRWKRRLRLLTSLAEQLKSKECKSVIGMLIMAKSRIMKKWKSVDLGITDAINETKDKVRYLESMKRFMNQLYSRDINPSAIINTTLPGIIASIKQMDSISRYFSRQGFLGYLFCKVTNQIVLACKSYIMSALESDTVDIWSVMEKEILNKEEPLGAAENSMRNIHIQVESRLMDSLAKKDRSPHRGLQSSRSKLKDVRNTDVGDDSLYNRLKACLTVQGFYHDCLSSLRESLGTSQNTSNIASYSSLPVPQQSSFKPVGRTSKGLRSSLNLSPAKRLSLIYDPEPSGVSLIDQGVITCHLDVFCLRIRHVCDSMNTLSQYNKFVGITAGLPRPRREDIRVDSKRRDSHNDHGDNVQLEPESEQPLRIDITGDKNKNVAGDASTALIDLSQVIEEEQEGEDDFDTSSTSLNQIVQESESDVNHQTGLTRSDVQMLNRYFQNNRREDTVTVNMIIGQHMKTLTAIMRDGVTIKNILDVESKEKGLFSELYASFTATVEEMEAFLAAYLHAVFARKMTTAEGLAIMTRFVPIQQRLYMRVVIAEKFVDIFDWFEDDLDKIQALYELEMKEPPVLRNAPPTAGAISWARNLLIRIEEPMKIFKENKSVSQLKDFGRVAKIYNKIASALVTFEGIWFTHWKLGIENAKSGLKATLFVLHPHTKRILVNADDKVLELIQEAKWLSRMGICLPECAQYVLKQEVRFKHYKDNLELCIKDLSEVCASVRTEMSDLFKVHIERTLQYFHPGLSTLAWDSMNIDAFLHQIHTGTSRLRSLVDHVNAIMKAHIDNAIEEISTMIFFDCSMIFSKSWPLNEFTEMIEESVNLKAQELYTKVQQIEFALKDCIIVLTSKVNPTNIKGLEQTVSCDRITNGSHKLTPDEDRMMHDLLDHYSEEIFEAVRLAVRRSLVLLAESSGCNIEPATRNKPLPSSKGLEPVILKVSKHPSSASSPAKSRSILQMLSEATWATVQLRNSSIIQFDISINFAIPRLSIDPDLSLIQEALNKAADSIKMVPNGVKWSNITDIGELFMDDINMDDGISQAIDHIMHIVEALQPVVKQHIYHFSMFDFLWKDDMVGTYNNFVQNDPNPESIKQEVEYLLKIEAKVKAIPDIIPVGPIHLNTDPVKNALSGFAIAWKTQYVSALHKEAKKMLDDAMDYRQRVEQRLQMTVSNLDELNSTLHLLEEVHDMENKIDKIYLPIENMYAKLREFELRLPRAEVQAVDRLREKWQELLDLVEHVGYTLLKEKRDAFEQELDKQVKTFVVEVIQFRNAFDAQGPSMPGISPSEAVRRLTDFQQRYAYFNMKRKTIDSVSMLFGIASKPFLELDKTGEELELLGLLYGLFQKFIRFDELFRDTLWSEVDLTVLNQEVELYWDECLALPSKLKDWDSYNNMKTSIQEYLSVFPLLHELASKEIRNRHWLQVMAVTGSSFQLEANVFMLKHLLDIGLMEHRHKIIDICRSASRELELEVKLRMTEEEWTEQVLNFEQYKMRGFMYLDKLFTERLLEQLEEAQALLAQMLTSRYIGPLREEVAGWAEKLTEVGEVFELWLEVQDQWQYLEAIFSNEGTCKELPQEAKKFHRIDKGWTKMMKKAFDTRNVLQYCYGGEVPKGVVLRHIGEELEVCFKSLTGYLDKKRYAFPRFYLFPDPVLLALLSRPTDLESVKPHLKTIFSAVSSVRVVKVSPMDEESELLDEEADRRTQSRSHKQHRTRFESTANATKLDKRLTAITERTVGVDRDTDGSLFKSPMEDQVDSRVRSSLVSIVLPSETALEETITLEAIAVYSIEGEVLELNYPVCLCESVESWLNNILKAISTTLEDMLRQAMEDVNNGVPMEDWVMRYPTQVCRHAMLYFWTKECEQGVFDARYDRRALFATGRKFTQQCNKLPLLISKSSWRMMDECVMHLHRLRLEHLTTQSLFLRDTIDFIATKKIREVTDFEWRRNTRIYTVSDESSLGLPRPYIYILDTRYTIGSEFYGAQSTIGLTALSDKCFLSMSLAISTYKGAMLTGSTGVGKTETVKGFSSMLGRFLAMFQCSPSSNPPALGRMLQGIAMDGCWGCFDDMQKLKPDCLATLINHMQSIFGALRSGQKFCFLTDGQEVPLKINVALYLTYNPATALPNYTLPDNISANFRPVSLVKPDLGLIMKAKCSQLNFKNPAIMGTRLKLLAELVKDQLSEDAHHNFSAESLTAALQCANNRRKAVREERSADKYVPEKSAEKQRVATNSLELSDISRSNSQQSLSTGVGFSVASNKGRKGSNINTQVNSAKAEHAIIEQAIIDIIGPRLTEENYTIFLQVLKDLFSGLPKPQASQLRSTSPQGRCINIESALESTVQSAGLIPHKPWFQKAMELYNISQVHQGIIVAGPPGSGKSALIQTLVDSLRGSLNMTGRTAEKMETNHKLQKLYPLVVDDMSSIFGFLNHNNDWVDGILTSAWRKASRNQSTTWLCMDGPLNPTWVDNFSSVLDSSKVLNLDNGDKLYLSNNIKLLFETDDIRQASPALVARCGVLYVDKSTVGWQPIAQAWLEQRSSQEVHVLERTFEKTVDAVSHFVANETRPRMQLSEVGMFKTCINLLSAMLAENVEIGGEMHIERLYLFCLMWSFGGLLDEKDRRGFNDLLASLSSSLPDDDRDICFFDYYVDESGEWDPWSSRIPESVYTDNQHLLGEVFVDTIDTIRTRLLMEFAAASGQNMLLVGPRGCGKTSMVNDFLDMQDTQAHVSKRLVYSGSSTASQLQQFIEANIYHRQGFVYGAKENKKLQLFIDDLNLPEPDRYSVQHVNELLRRMVDDKVLCTTQRPFEWRSIEGLVIFSTMSMSSYPSISSQAITPRLLRHFAVFHLDHPGEDNLKHIINCVLDTNMRQRDCSTLDVDVHNALVTASCRILTAVKDVLRPTPMAGRKHYAFNLKDIVKCIQCMKILPDESRAHEKVVVSLWKHEIVRIFRDPICRQADLFWFDETLEEIIKEACPTYADNLHQHFVTFTLDTRKFKRPVSTLAAKPKPVLQPIESLEEVHSCLLGHLTNYNEEFGHVHLDIMLSDNTIAHIIHMHRILKYQHSGNFLLVGPIGSHLTILAKLALHVADIPIHHIDTSKENTFIDGLRSAVRITGAEGLSLTFLFTARDLQNDLYLDAINSLLVSGYIPHLFSNDEMEGLLQALAPTMKRQHPSLSSDQNKFFISRVKTNLHLILCLPPDHYLLDKLTSHYPGMLTGSQVIWMRDWPKELLINEARYFVNSYNLTKDCELDLSEGLVAAISNIHSFVLQDCRQMKWAGDINDEVTLNQVKPHEKKKEQLKATSVVLPNRPYSKALILEHIKSSHCKQNNPSCTELFVGPTTFLRFMENFKYIYTNKALERTEKVTKLKQVLDTLDMTRQEAENMKEEIKTISQNFETTKAEAASQLIKVSNQSTVLERLKTDGGVETALSAFLELNEMSEDEDEDDDLLYPEERDEYDEEFERMREANFKTRQGQAKEEYTESIKKVDLCRRKLAVAREQVLQWRVRVDRPCIERVRGFQNPTLLVGQVMEMVMTLIGKRLPNQRLDSGRDANTPSADMTSGQYSTSSSSTMKNLGVRKNKQKESVERLDRKQWKAFQATMNDTAKFVDMLHNVPWEDGLPDDVINAVEKYLAPKEHSSLGGIEILTETMEVERSAKGARRMQSPEVNRGITLYAAKYSSEDAATLVSYTIAIVEYTRLCAPLKQAIERKQELEREIEENDRLQKELQNECLDIAEDETVEEEELTEDDLPRIEMDVNNLQAEFDAIVVKKYRFKMELISINDRLRAASEVINSLQNQEAKWRQYVKENENNDMMVANSLVAAAFLVYCSPMNTDARLRIGDFFMSVCEQHGIPMPHKQLFKNMELIDFLYKPIVVQELMDHKLPVTRVHLENAAILMQTEMLFAWPLLCDPSSRVVDWIRGYHEEKQLVVVKYTELRSQFDTCLADGLSLLVTDCNMNDLCNDPRFTNVLIQREKFVAGKPPFKIMIGDHEVECQPHFRMFLHTSRMPNKVPQSIMAYMSVIYFCQMRIDVEEELLDRFMALEKGRMSEERTALLQEKLLYMQKLETLDQKMIDCLASDMSLHNDLVATKKLAELMKRYDEAIESKGRVDSAIQRIVHAREGYRDIAVRAAACFDTTQYLRVINPLYHTSFKQQLNIYDAAIVHSDRVATKTLIERLTYSMFFFTLRMLEQRDRPLFSLLMALEVEDSLGRVGVGEREFLISPSFGSVIMSAVNYLQPNDTKIMMAKKPFDWMTDEQFNNLQILAIHYEWFQEMFDRMSKDGRETQWRVLCESDQPEIMLLPDKMDDVYTDLQRLLVLRSMRPDRVMQATAAFVNSVLGKKYSGEMMLDLKTVYRQSSPTIPVLVFLKNEHEVTLKAITDFAHRSQVSTLSIVLSCTEHGQERLARKYLQKGMDEGHWVLLQGAHNAVPLLNSLQAMFTDREFIDPAFRCWIISEPVITFPISILKMSIKVLIDKPQTIKETMLRSFNWFLWKETDILKQSNRNEWPIFLHNLTYLHGAIHLRARFSRGGWNNPADFKRLGNNELQEALQLGIREFQEQLLAVSSDGKLLPRNTSWSGMRYQLAEIIYGNYVMDPVDQNCLNALIDYWISPFAVKKEFEVARSKYRHPQAFFTIVPRMNQLIQSLENLSTYMLEIPEACSIHPSQETVLGEEQYVFTRLNRIYDSMPSSETLSHELFPRPPSALDVYAKNFWGEEIWDQVVDHGPLSHIPLLNEGIVHKAHLLLNPSIIGVNQQNNNQQLSEHGVFASASFAMLKMRKEVELWEICHIMLNKVPRAYNKEYVVERLKKLPSNSSFHLYLMKELDMMYHLLVNIKTTLQAIKNACELGSMGDQLSPETLSVAVDLYRLCLPAIWCQLAGPTAPPPSYSLSAWLLDLQNRCQHFERILVMGREKMPAYWLGAFFYPRGLISILKQEYYRQTLHDHTSNVETVMVQSEITGRDKDHLRDPPTEGIFVYGVYIWGCSWEKTTGELQDAAPRNSFTAIPVVHLTCVSQSERSHDLVRAAEIYACPVYQSRVSQRQPIIELELSHAGIPSSRWALRGLSATIRQY